MTNFIAMGMNNKRQDNRKVARIRGQLIQQEQGGRV